LSYTDMVCWATLLWCVELHCCGVLSYTAVACWATLLWCAELHCCGVLSYTAVACWATLTWCVELHCCGVLSYTAVACWATLLWCVELHCCGLKDYMDWERNIYFNCSSPGVEKCGVPFSCCQCELISNPSHVLLLLLLGQAVHCLSIQVTDKKVNGFRCQQLHYCMSTRTQKQPCCYREASRLSSLQLHSRCLPVVTTTFHRPHTRLMPAVYRLILYWVLCCICC